MWTRDRNLTSDALFRVLRLKLKAQAVIRAGHVRAHEISIDATDIGGDLANAGAVIASAPRCRYPVWIKFPASVSSQSRQESVVDKCDCDFMRARHVHVPEGQV